MASYRRLYKTSYSEPRRGINSAIHLQFRETWDQNIEDALRTAAKMARKGWRVDLRRGALTKSQAERIAGRLQEDYNVEFIPVTEWMGEKIVLIAYKPRRKPKPKKEAPTPTQGPTAEELYQKFVKFVRGGEELAREDVEQYWKKGGYIMDDHRVMALVRPDADSFTTQRSKIMSGQYLHYGLKADFNLIKKLRAAKRQGIQNVRIGSTVVRINNLIKAARVMQGYEVELRSDREAPLWLLEPKSGNAVVIAPVLDPVEAVTKNLSEIL